MTMLEIIPDAQDHVLAQVKFTQCSKEFDLDMWDNSTSTTHCQLLKPLGILISFLLQYS